MRDRLLVAAILRPSAKSDEEAVELADELIHFEEQHNPRQIREAREARKREEALKALPPKKPTVAELEAILNGGGNVNVSPDGSTVNVTPAPVTPRPSPGPAASPAPKARGARKRR